MEPPVRLSVPPTMSVVPAAMVFVALNAALLSETSPAVSIVAAPPLKVTLPPFALNEPPVTVVAPVTVRVPEVEANEPPLRFSGPFRVMLDVPPAKAAPPWVKPALPTVRATPAACVMVPPYAAATDIPLTLTATLIVAFLDPVASKVATSAAPGMSPPSQLAGSFQLFVGPSPLQVRTAPETGPDENANVLTSATRRAMPTQATARPAAP